MMAIILKTVAPFFVSAFGSYVGYRFVKRGVRERVIGSVVGGIIALITYIAIKLMDKYVF